MLTFFKKSGPRNKSRTSPHLPSKSEVLGESETNVFRQKCGSWSCLEEEEDAAEVFKDETSECTTMKSRLSKTLPEILSDKSALGYFFQFLEARGSVALIKFWLEVECVCGSCGIQDIRTSGIDLLDSVCEQKKATEDVSGLADSNDNYRCNNIMAGDVCSRDKLSCNDSVNSNDPLSECHGTPNTSQLLNGADESKLEFKIRKPESAAFAASKQDASHIYKRYIVKEALGPGRIPNDMLNIMQSALHSQNMGSMLKCLCDLQQIVYRILEEEHMNDFLRSDFHCKHQIDVLTSGNVQLADILYNETAFFHFMEFMEIEGKRELLDFWMAAINYKHNLLQKEDTTNPAEAQTDALIIYDKYFSLQATMSLGFSDKVRFQVEQNICREDGQGPGPDCFDLPCRIIYRYLDKHYLTAFLSSQLYYKYLSELISTIQSSPCPALHPRLKRTGSDCSSEMSTASVGTQKTLPEQHGRLCANEGLSIDTRQLHDPDSLWRRQKYNLSVGYVNEMGRFVTEIEPNPHRKYESRLSRAMKRLVNVENDKAKEEMAWKIAEMIVGEITSLTLGCSAGRDLSS